MSFKFIFISCLHVLFGFSKFAIGEGVTGMIVDFDDKSNHTLNPLKGSTFRITVTSNSNFGDVTFCTVKEVFLKKSLHFSKPPDANYPDVKSVQNGRISFDTSNPKECTIVVKQAKGDDDGTWNFTVGYGRNQNKKWQNHLEIVMVKADCKWGDWKEGTCSKVCPGKRHDTREQLQGSMYGGKTCEEVDPNNGHERIVQCCESCTGNKCPKRSGNSASMTQGKKEFLILTTGLLMMVSRILL